MGAENALMRIDEIADANLLATAGGGRMAKARQVATAMTELRQLLTDTMLKDFVSLQGTDIGFRTDQDGKGGYKPAVIRDVIIEAVLRGYSPTGNEFNIIAGRFYATRNGLERKVRDCEGLTDLKLAAGVPQKMSDGALVEYHAAWRLNGQADSIDCVLNGASDTRIPVRVNSGMGIDAILGKAERKMLAKIFKRITGSAQSLGVHDEEVVEDEVVAETIPVIAAAPPTPESEPDSLGGEDLERLVIQAQEGIDLCTTPAEVSAAVKVFVHGLPVAEREAIANYGVRVSTRLGNKPG